MLKSLRKAINAPTLPETLTLLTFALILVFLATATCLAATPLVEPQWLKAHLADKDIRILDLQPINGYKRVHLPGALNTQYNDWRHKKGKEGKALPDVAFLEDLLGAMGVETNSHIILTPIGANANEVAIATRIYWTLKTIGHENVSILDGGLIAYSKLPGAQFTRDFPQFRRTEYEANLNTEMAPTIADVLEEWKQGTSFVDYRSAEEYHGKVGGPRPGTIPGSKNLSFDMLVEPAQGGRFLPAEQLRSLYKDRSIPLDKPQIAFCQSGHRASLGWFVSHELLGNSEARLYDGSMSEWSQYPDHPIAIPTK